MRKSHRLPSAEPQAPLPQPTMSQMTQVAKECFLLPAKAHWVGEAVMAVPCWHLVILQPGCFRGSSRRAWAGG